MRKLMFVLVAMLLAQLVKAETVTLTIIPGSTMSETYFAHHEANLLPYSKEYEENWLKINNQTDFKKIRPGDYLFECQPKLAEVAVVEPVTAEEIINESETVQQEVVSTPRKQYEPSGIVQLDFDKYEKVEWSPAPQRTTTIPETLTPIVEIQIAAHTEPAQEVELLMPTEGPETFTMKAEEKIAEANRAAYKRLNRRSYPRESFLSANLPNLLLGSVLLITFITLVSWRKNILQKLVHIDFKSKAPTRSPREAELEALVKRLQNSLKQAKESVTPLERENEWYRQKLSKVMAPYEIPFSGRKKVYFEVTSRRPGGQPFQVFFPGLDRNVVYDNEVLFEALIELINKPEEIWRKHINLPKEVVTALKGSVELKEKRRKLVQEQKPQPSTNRAREFAHAGRI